MAIMLGRGVQAKLYAKNQWGTTGKGSNAVGHPTTMWLSAPPAALIARGANLVEIRRGNLFDPSAIIVYLPQS